MGNNGKIITWAFLAVAPILLAIAMAFFLLIFRDGPNFPDSFYYSLATISLIIAVNTFFRVDKGAGVVLALTYIAIFWFLHHFEEQVMAVFKACHFYDFYVWAYKTVHPD